MHGISIGQLLQVSYRYHLASLRDDLQDRTRKVY